jgi:hypothetical protein
MLLMLILDITSSGQKGDYLVEVMGFKAFFGLPCTHGMIDVIRIHL